MAAEGRKYGTANKLPLGLQLYSLRADFARDVPGTLKKVRDYGIKLVETAGTYNLPPEKFKALLDENGLNPISGHFPYERFRDDLDAVVRDAKTLGLQYTGCAWIPHEGDFDEKECRDAAAVFNRAGEALSKAGIKFFYHTHGYEFQPHGDGTLFDLLMKETNPKFVNYEMDVFWIVHPGQDPVKLLGKYSKRWVLMHVKDMKEKVRFSGDGGDASQWIALFPYMTNAGNGVLDLATILPKAKAVGVKHFIVEQDMVANPEDALKKSHDYLASLKA